MSRGSYRILRGEGTNSDVMSYFEEVRVSLGGGLGACRPETLRLLKTFPKVDSKAILSHIYC